MTAILEKKAKKTAKFVENKIYDHIHSRLNRIAGQWGIDTMNGTIQRDPSSRIYQKWQRANKLDEYLKAFEVYQELTEILDAINYGDIYEEIN